MEQYLRAPLFPYPPVLIITSEASYESTVMEKKYAKTKQKNARRTQKNVRRSFRRAIASSVHAAAVGSA